MTTSRNFWPLGITTVCALFFAGTVGLVVMACSQKVELVSTDYYEKELKFQGQIDRAERARREAPQTSVSFDAAHQQIRICLPPGQGRENVSGTIELYRPSAAGLDRAMPLEPDAEGTQRLDAARLAPGLWKVRVSWTCEKRNYYLEQKVVVSPRPA
ncbi:MAG TPA: FixH family protein [Candidatus Acidoferrum sp.]|nr:FixH family protein [Candidatus Acidoferrum sp.]